MKKYLKVLIALFVIGVISIVGASSVMAENTAYCTYNNNGKLFFYYDDNYGSTSFDKWEVGTGTDVTNKWNQQGYYILTYEVIFDDSFASYTDLETTAHWFDNFIYLTTITNLTNLNTSNVTDMNHMFSNCKKLKKLDLSSFDTSKVTDFSYMFYNSYFLNSLDLSNFNTSNATNMDGMFDHCKKLVTVTDLENFDTSNVDNMTEMFKNCYSLQKLDLSKWDTSKVESMNLMFNECTSLTTLDLSNWNTSSVTDLEYMFNGCTALTTIYVSDTFVTTKVSHSDEMFTSCTSLVGGNGTQYDSTKVDSTYARADLAGQPGYFTLKSSESKNEEVNAFWNWYNKNNVSGPKSVTTVTEDASIDKKNDVVTTDIPTLTYDVVTVTNGAGTSNPVVSDNSGASSSLVNDTMPIYFLILGVAFVGLIATLVLRVSKKN